jgi:hypothetical protein
MRQLLAFPLVAMALAVGATVVLAAQDPARPQSDGDAPPPPAEAPAKVEMNDLEKKFEKTMSGATLVGYFTAGGENKADHQPPVEERYVISKVTKIGEDQWLFVARIGDAQFPVPLPVPVKWAGDTPVISVTKIKVPGMGTYTARVLIYDDHYAGTWDAGDHGGHLWGRIERKGEKPVGDAKAPAPAPKGK